jgi:hypothetical protein
LVGDQDAAELGEHVGERGHGAFICASYSVDFGFGG